VNLNRLGAGVFTMPGHSEAAIRTDDGDRLYKDARNNDRVIFDDSDPAGKARPGHGAGISASAAPSGRGGPVWHQIRSSD
jgi:hypothetical protein